MIAQLVIRGHYRRRNVTSADKLSKYWSRVHSWDVGLSHVKFAFALFVNVQYFSVALCMFNIYTGVQMSFADR